MRKRAASITLTSAERNKYDDATHRTIRVTGPATSFAAMLRLGPFQRRWQCKVTTHQRLRNPGCRSVEVRPF